MSQDVRGMTKTLSGEAKVEVLGADASWTLVADHREDGPVLLRRSSKEYPDPDELARLRYGYENSLRLADVPGVSRVRGLERVGNGLVLVMDDEGARPLRALLDGGPLSIEAALDIAARIARVLGELHGRNVVHKWLTPASILVHPQTREVRLTSFDLASRLDHERPTLVSPSRIAGALAYVSPEQTGRMNRGVDYRSDFYALGVNLYEMLTGRVPFQSSDPLTLIHGHIAVPPPPPRELRPEIPPGVADVLMKLLAKNAEDRYQSAFGAAADLKACLAELAATGTVAHFEAGKSDVCAVFRVPQKLYGRDAQRAVLISAFEGAASGVPAVVLVSGPSGLGKSALVNELQRPIVERRGYFAAGKFDQLANAPYAALIHAFRQLFRELLLESDAQVDALRRALSEALGANTRVIADVIPEVEQLLGPQPAVAPVIPAEAQNRFNAAFSAFVGVFARPEHPLALLLDDLQWADASTLALLQRLLRDAGGRHLLIIGAFRDGEVRAGDPLALSLAAIREGKTAVSEISLTRLSEASVADMVADALGMRDRAEVAELAAIVADRTDGNPFFVRQLLGALSERGLVAFDPAIGRFRWSLEKVREAAVTDDMASLLAARLQRVSARTQELLRLAASIGGEFDLATLAFVSGQPARVAAADLWGAVGEGLIVPFGDAYKYVPSDAPPDSARPSHDTTYAFLHDRVREAAYAMIPEAERPGTHLRIGRVLLQHTAASERGERLFEIVNQLVRGVALIDDAGERLELSRLCLAAGMKAKAATAYASAQGYLVAGMELLPGGGWEGEYDLAFALYRERAECDYILGRFDEAEAEFAALLDRSRSLRERSEIQILRMALYQAKGDFPASIRAGRDGLALHGVTVPPDEELPAALTREGEALKLLLAGRPAADIAGAPEATSEDDKVFARLCANAIIYGSYGKPQLLQLLSMLLVRHSLDRGNSAGSALGYASYGMRLGGAMGDYVTAQEVGLAGLALSERLDDLPMQSIVQFYFGNFLNPWRRHAKTSFPHLERAYAGCRDTGSILYAAVSLMQITLIGFLTGEELGAHRERAAQSFELAFRLNDMDRAHFIGVFQWAMALLADGRVPEGAPAWMNREQLLEKLAHYKSAVAVIHTCDLQHAYLFRDFPRARAAARLAEAHAPFVFGHIVESELRFYAALLSAALLESAAEDERAALQTTVDTCLGKLRLWAENCPENFLHKRLLIEAELSRVSGADAEAADLYDRAIAAAAASEYVQNQALGSELAGRFYLARGRRRTAQAYLSDARHAWLRWGAGAKVAQLDDELGELLPRGDAQAQGGASGGGAMGLDIATVLKATQAISGEIVLDELLRKLMSTVLENAGAQRGLLILKEGSGDDQRGQLVVEASPGGDGSEAVLRRGEAGGAVDYPESIVHRVERTRERVILGDAANEGPFRADAYVQRSGARSVLCMPVVKQKKLVGVLYLENKLVTHAFTPERCELLDLVAAQAAISLENALLYETLDQRVRDRTRELRASNEELSLTLDRLKQTQKQLVMQEKLASLGVLTSGIAHEIRNPLNFVNNFAESSIGLAQELSDEIAAQRARLAPEAGAAIDDIVEQLSQNVSKITEHGKRADGIVKAMLELSRQGAGEKRPVDLNALVGEYVKLDQQSSKGRAGALAIETQIEESYDGERPSVEVVPDDLGRVVMNLVNNARYAAAAKRRRLGEAFTPVVRVETRVLGDQVELRVRDNGDGVPAAVRDRIFNPFFTTKPTGEGTGLGLSMAFEIVQSAGGTLECETEEGQYAEFIVRLPQPPPG
jgi:predicted ATPase/signal transduction histidine kinase